MSNIPSRRREFLKSCASVGLGLAAPMRFLQTVRADDNRELPSYDGPYYIVFNAAGGWDTTYLMDPKGVGGINRLYERRRHSHARRAPICSDWETQAGRPQQRGLLRRVRRRVAGGQRLGLFGQQPLALFAIHGNRQTRQSGLSNLCGAGGGLSGAKLSAVVFNLRQLFGDGKPRRHVARTLPAVAETDRQRRLDRRKCAVTLSRRFCAQSHRRGVCASRRASGKQSRFCHAASERKTCCTRLRSIRRHWRGSRRMFQKRSPSSDWPGRRRSPWRRSKRASASRRTCRSDNSTATPIMIETR